MLENLYLDPSKPSSLGGIDRLFREAKELIPDLKKSQVVEFLQTQTGYTQHKAIKRKFQRRQTISTDICDLYQSDLIDLPRFAEYNDGFRYIMTIIDCFSRYGFAIPLKNKKPIGIVEGFVVAFKEYGIPNKLQTDLGGEYVNSTVKKFLKDCGVIFYQTRNDDIKCALAE